MVKSGDRPMKTKDFLLRHEDYMYLSLRYGGIRQRMRGIKILVGESIRSRGTGRWKEWCNSNQKEGYTEQYDSNSKGLCRCLQKI